MSTITQEGGRTMIGESVVRCLSSHSQVRAIDVDRREVTYVAATETPVDTHRGPEVLRMDGMTSRRHVPFLDSHRQGDAGAVIGSLTYEVVGRELHIAVRYATTARAEELWTLVKEGHLQAVSVGFLVRERIVLGDGEAHGAGDSQVRGPATVVTSWELIEVSQVAIGADPNALRRCAMEGASETNEPEQERGAAMGDPSNQAASAATPGAPQAPEASERGATPANDAAEQIQAARLDGVRRSVMAICPEALRGFAEQVLLEQGPSASLESVRAALLERSAANQPPVGTPSQPEDEPRADTQTREVTAEQAAAALRALRS